MLENEEHSSVVAESPPVMIKSPNSPVDSSGPEPSPKAVDKDSPKAPPIPAFPAPKTDKPRPHICATCTRSFARLEHLKRHERSHTKEKPFECQACTRCFARRDLLLRHQQKLHSSTTPSSRPRNGRRESTAGVAGARVRKSSVASTQTSTMRPRANTLSHIDTSALGILGGGNPGRPFLPLHSHHDSFTGLMGGPNFGFRATTAPGQGSMMGLPRLDTHTISGDFSSGLRTAPPFGGFGAEFDMGNIEYGHDNGNTINPHELHMDGLGIESSMDSHHAGYVGLPASQVFIDDDGTFDWMTHGFDNQLSFGHANENAIDDSSPSAMSTNSPAFHDANGNVNMSQIESSVSRAAAAWQQSSFSQTQMLNSPMSMDVNPLFADMSPNLPDTVSPKSLMAHNNGGYDVSLSSPPDFSSIDQATMLAFSNGVFSLPFSHDTIGSTASTASMDSSMRNSSVAINYADLVTDHTRNAVIAALAHTSGFGQRKMSVPNVSSPLSPNGANKMKGFNPNTFPGTQDLQRYVSACVRYFHPHLPFLHLPTLNFDSIEYNVPPRMPHQFPSAGVHSNVGGGTCLMLAMAAIGALYEHEIGPSRDLFECGKRMINSFLEGRRKTNSARKPFTPHQAVEQEDTPLWLVQAMLLNVIYGHNCGDKTAADIASNHCAALVSLARGAELAKPFSSHAPGVGHHMASSDGWTSGGLDTTESEWYEWKIVEERKRTLYAVFVLSSMLVMAYNRAPALTNSEIRLDLPCEEELWLADSAQAWRAAGGAVAAQATSTPFANALTYLLTAAQRRRLANAGQLENGSWQKNPGESELRPSSFGSLVLINALHNYIWETRQRHLGRQWTPQEVEAMHAHIEPALQAWSAAWSSNPMHVIERPNPFGAGPLPADSIPLLDLAYVRLFVDLGRSKEAYWQRDYEAMSQELAKVSEPGLIGANQDRLGMDGSSKQEDPSPNEEVQGSQPSPREQHLRKAAFYAADHLVNAERMGMGLMEKTSRELPLQSILCACDSAQVLSEWLTAMQIRVGRHMGVLDQGKIDLAAVPAILLLDDQDRKLLRQVEELLMNGEQRFDPQGATHEARDGDYGSRILVLISRTMARAAIWPVTKLMAEALQTQAEHNRRRVLASVQRR